MPHLEFSKEITALLVIDPYNEFISAGGKLWDRIKFSVVEATHPLDQYEDKPVVARVK